MTGENERYRIEFQHHACEGGIIEREVLLPLEQRKYEERKEPREMEEEEEE